MRLSGLLLPLAAAYLAGAAPAQQPAPLPPKSTVPAFTVPDILVDGQTGKVRMLATTRTVYLGRVKSAKPGKAALQFGKYSADAPEPPASLDRLTKSVRTVAMVYGNDREGNCVSASTAHGLGIVSVYDSDSPGEIAGSASEASREYHNVGGPGDNGLDPVEALEYWRRNGYTLGGTKRVLEAWGSFNPQDVKQLKVCTIVFGGRLVFMVPAEWMNQVRDGAVWDKPARYNFVGGHDVRIIDYNEKGVRIATWGVMVTVTWRALADPNIFDGAYFEVFSDWLNKDRVTGSGISAKRLAEDIAKVKNGETPSWQPDDVTPPPPPPPPPGPGGVVTVTVDGATITIDPATKKVTVPAGWTTNAPGPPPVQTVEEQLKARGLTPEQIDLIIRLVAAFLARGPAPTAQGSAPEAWPVAQAFAAEGVCAGGNCAVAGPRRPLTGFPLVDRVTGWRPPQRLRR
jgi:hypothetical protein